MRVRPNILDCCGEYVAFINLRRFVDDVAPTVDLCVGRRVDLWQIVDFGEGHDPLASLSRAAPSGPLALPRASRQSARRRVSRSAPLWRAIDATMALSRAAVSMALPNLTLFRKISPSVPSAK